MTVEIATLKEMLDKLTPADLSMRCRALHMIAVLETGEPRIVRLGLNHEQSTDLLLMMAGVDPLKSVKGKRQ